MVLSERRRISSTHLSNSVLSTVFLRIRCSIFAESIVVVKYCCSSGIHAQLVYTIVDSGVQTVLRY